MGSIDGSGTTRINAGSDLTANHIVQGALVIAGSAGSPASVKIDASDPSGNPLSQQNGLALAGASIPLDAFEAGGIGFADLSNGSSHPLALSLGNSAVGGNPSAVPEPATLVLVLFALSGVIAQRIALRRRER